MVARVSRIVPPLPQTERGANCQINTDSTGDRVVYCNGTNVLWRSLAPFASGGSAEKPEDVFTWKGHTKRTTVAAISPNNQWVVSGDVTGAVRVWGAKGDNVQKHELKLWDGCVKDASWSGDSTRIVASGDGKETRAVALLADTGSKTGEVGGHSKQINSVSFRSQRPFRVITGGEDMLVAFHQGPPFKYSKGHSVHTNFVNGVRFSPDGEFAVSVGSDSKVCLYDGKEGDLVKEFEKPEGISGSLWAVAWSPNSAYVATAGGDKKLRVWSREEGKQVDEALVGAAELEDMLLGVTWPTATRIISVCLDGRLMLWDVNEQGTVTLANTINGTQGPLTCLARDVATGALIQGGGDGFVASILPGQGPQKIKIGKGIQHILAHGQGYSGPAEAWVFSLDDCARKLVPDACTIDGAPVAIKEFVVGAAWLDVQESKVVLATGKNSLHCLSSGGIEWSKPSALPRRPTALASSPSSARLVVALERPDGMVSAGVQNSQYDIHLFSITDTGSADGIVPGNILQGHVAEVTALRFSPSGEMLASADAGSKILVWSCSTDGSATIAIDTFTSHSARIASLDWFANGRRLVSGGLDQTVFLWSIDNQSDRIKVTEAHKGGVTAVVACEDDSFACVGSDGFLKVYQID